MSLKSRVIERVAGTAALVLLRPDDVFVLVVLWLTRSVWAPVLRDLLRPVASAVAAKIVDRLRPPTVNVVSQGGSKMSFRKERHPMARKGTSGSVHTTTNPNGSGWVNQVDGHVTSTHRTKENAEKAGRKQAEDRSTEHVIHKRDGTIGERNSYGNDPKSRPG